MFMQLQRIVFIQLQGKDIFVDFQGNIFIQGTYIYSQKMYSFKEIVFVQGMIIISRKLLYSVFIQGNTFIQGNYLHSRKYVNSRKLYSFDNIAFPDIAETFVQQISPATL